MYWDFTESSKGGSANVDVLQELFKAFLIAMVEESESKEEGSGKSPVKGKGEGSGDKSKVRADLAGAELSGGAAAGECPLAERSRSFLRAMKLSCRL